MKNNRHVLSALHLLKFWTLRTLPAWSLIALMIFLIQIAVCGIVHDNEKVKQMLTVLDILPSFVKTALGGDYLKAGNTAALITIGYKHPFVLFLFMFFAVSVPTGFLAGEVQKGTMELILSRCVKKSNVYIFAGLITVTGMFALAMVMFLGTVAAVHIYDFGKPIPLGMFFRIGICAGELACTVGGIALLNAAMFASRNIAVGISVAFLVINYFVSVIADWWPRMIFLKKTTLFYYVGGSEIVTGWPAGNMWVLGIIFLIAVITGAIIWNRRDLPL